MANINLIKNDLTGMSELFINGLQFVAQEESTFRIPISVLNDLDIVDFPTEVVIVPTIDDHERDRPYLFPEISNLGDGRASVTFFHCFPVGDILHSIIGYPLYQETLAELLLLNTELNPEILANYYDVENQMFHLHCSIELNAGTIQNIIIETENYFYSFAELVVNNNSERLRAYFRNELGLAPEPPESAKLKYLFD